MKSFRFLVIALFLAAPYTLFAQSRGTTDAGVSIVFPAFDESSLTDDGETFNLDFDEKTSYGLSLNRYWTDDFSTELAYQKLKGDLKLSVDPITINAGSLDAESITAIGQWHFRRGARFMPYVGAGLAHISGDFKFDDALLEPGDPAKVDLESKTTWTVAGGANIRLTDRLFLGLDLKYIPWSPTEKGGAVEDAIDVNPLTFSTGLKLRF